MVRNLRILTCSVDLKASSMMYFTRAVKNEKLEEIRRVIRIGSPTRTIFKKIKSTSTYLIIDLFNYNDINKL